MAGFNHLFAGVCVPPLEAVGVHGNLLILTCSEMKTKKNHLLWKKKYKNIQVEFTWAVLGHPIFPHCLPTGVAGCWDGQARSHLGLCLCARVPVLPPSLSTGRGGAGNCGQPEQKQGSSAWLELVC